MVNKGPFTYYVSHREGGESKPISDFFWQEGEMVCQFLIFSNKGGRRFEANFWFFFWQEGLGMNECAE